MNSLPNEIACIILAGGSSSRMGLDKRRLRLWGETKPMLLAHIVNLLIPRCTERVVVLNDPEQWADLPAKLVPDRVLGAGPLGGLAAGLAAMNADRALVLACDLPLIHELLLDALIAYPMQSDALVPIQRSGVNDTREPLLAIYHRRCLPIAEACLKQGERRMTALLDQVRVHYLEPREWQQYDPEGRSFLNLNRPEDVQALRAATLCL